MFLILIAISHFSSAGISRNIEADGTMVTRYGATTQKSAKAHNAWNRLNLSPAGVEVKTIRKGGVL